MTLGGRKVSPIALAIALMTAAGPLPAQLRPLEPAQWQVFETGHTFAAALGVARFTGQRASLAGTRGDLLELGNFAIAWRTGRVVLAAEGTAQRRFRERSTFTLPYPDVDEARDGRRHDSGDYRVSTTVRLTPDAGRWLGVLRFGARLPTTDNTTGLDRDAVDFFALLGGAANAGRIAVEAETGLGIHTTREARFEQEDLFLYSLRGEYRRFIITPSLAVLGQLHGTTHSAIRGVENLGELRLGLRAGSRQWVRAELVKGYETFSPSSGVIISAGIYR